MAPTTKLTVAVSKNDRKLQSQRSEKMREFITKESNRTISKPKASIQQESPRGRQPKVLTPTRKKKITKFLKMAHLLPPEKEFGSEQWMKCLIAYMKEPKRTSPSVYDVEKWMADTTFFEDTIKKILSGIVLPSPQFASSGNSDTLSDTSLMLFDDFELDHLLNESPGSSANNEDKDEEMDETDSKQPNGYSEPVRGKTGWNAIYENHDNLDDKVKELPKKKLFKCEKEVRITLKRCDDLIKENHQSTIKNFDDGVTQQQQYPIVYSKPSTSFPEQIVGDTARVSIFPAGFKWKMPAGRQISKGQHLATATVSSVLPPHQNLQAGNDKNEDIIPIFKSAEDVLNALVKNEPLFLNVGDNRVESLNQSNISSGTMNDIGLLQTYANGILEISTRNTKAGNSTVNWKAANCCASALNFISQKRMNEQ